ncbi:GCN5-like N-acetyltransferase [Dioszegia hungarica]|uniref:GCN5-like N-acetyltransferase n=1 Tax=Dioszegia hungarica TaxID=4972 RepID=A0AA38HE61_9TREE|nr:GCN5-like N-acetyltransferase [Dioszegia hungarica]KAI9638898.1 GCN5-like N-acetyltransferase [Dioszegia hungarica]
MTSVKLLEQHFFASAPSLSAESHPSGWLIRSSAGYTKRGNSASPLDPSTPLTEASLAGIKSKLRPPAIIRITPLAHEEDDELLEQLGWKHLDPSIVMTRTLDRRPPASDSTLKTSVSSAPTSSWVRGFATASNLSPSHTETFRSTLNLIRTPFIPAYITLLDQASHAVAYGQAVRSDHVVGLYNIVVSAEHRGKGYGRAVTQALLDWGRAEGATTAYLQVTVGNAVGRRMYERMGFEEAYRYHYRVAP